jgi:integrase
LALRPHYALLLLYITTGMRRNEVMSLQGKEVTVEEKRIIIRGRVKGGDYQGREVTDGRVRAALLDYLRSGRRLHVLREDQPCGRDTTAPGSQALSSPPGPSSRT